MPRRWLGWRWLGLGLACLASLAWAQYAQLEDVRVSTSGAHTRVVFALSQPINPDLFMLRDPARLVVDMPDTIKADRLPENWPGAGVIRRLRSGIRHGDNLRVVLDLAHLNVKTDAYTLLPTSRHGHRLVVDLYAQAGQTAASAAKPAGASRDNAGGLTMATAKPLASAKPEHEAADSVSQGAGTEPVAYTPVAPTREIVVAVDPGHGGSDPGAIGPRGTTEKEVVMAISRKLANMIDEQPHMRAILTRTGDYYVGLRERRIIARKADADLFVSIHANAWMKPQPHGVSVFALSLDGATSHRAKLLAQRENSTLKVGGVSLENKNQTLASFMLDLAQSATIEASLDVARRVLNQSNDFTVLHQSEVQQAAFVVLKSPDIPSILVETGFITNPEEARKLQSDLYQTRMARSILQGIKGYYASYRPGTMVVKNQVHEVASGETLSGIAATYNVSVERLREYNNLQGSLLRVGQKLRIPPPRKQQVASVR